MATVRVNSHGRGSGRSVEMQDMGILIPQDRDHPPVTTPDSLSLSHARRSSFRIGGDKNAIVSMKRPSVFSPAASHLREKYVDKMKDMFLLIDTDKSGMIDGDEFFEFLTSIGKEVSLKQVQDILLYFDSDRSGDIDFNEFVLMMETVTPLRELYDAIMQDDDASVISLDAVTDTFSGLTQLSSHEKATIWETATALSPFGKKLTAISLSGLRKCPYHLGTGGFQCSRCDILADNLVGKTAYFAPEENYMLCSMCAGLDKTDRVKQETERRLKVR